MCGQRAFEIEPLNAYIRFFVADGLFATGRLEEADRVLDDSLRLWPRDSGLWFTRFWTYAFSSRGAEARAFAERVEGRPFGIPPADFDLCVVSARALETRSAPDIDQAVSGNLAAARHGLGYATNAMQVCSALGRVDDAYGLARAVYFATEPGPQFLFTEQQGEYASLRDPPTWMLFSPSCTAMRADPRFATLCRDIGLEAYWRASGHPPDFRQ
jgi:hypothetical protein